MIEEIKKRLDAGEVVELDCIAEYGFINNNKGHVREKEEILSSSLVVHSVDDGRDVVLHSSYFLRESDLEYFRIKCPAPTFDDLIDVAVKAVKDKVLHSMQIGENKRKGRYINFSQNGNSANEAHYENDTAPYAVINFINSLYTETFVIESEGDILKVNIKDDGAKIILTNKTELELSGSQDSSNQDGFALGLLLPNGRIVYYGISVLKGATVTQKKI